MSFGDDEKVARKYCFKASIQILHSNTGVPQGTYFAYDPKPTIAKEVERAATQHCLAFDDVVSGEVSLVFLAECPLELSDEIYYQCMGGNDDDDTCSVES